MDKTDGQPHFVNDPPDKYLCAKSRHILRNPVQAECGHRFCRDCVEYDGDDSWVCPVCEKTVYRKSTIPVTDKDIKHGIFSLVVYCAHEKNGCIWTGPWRQKKDHLSTCPYRMMVTCQICQQEFPKSEQEEHKRQLCYRPCPYCGKTIRTCLLKMHQLTDCSKKKKKVSGFAEPLERPRLGHACECHVPCCSLYTVVHGAFCIHGVTTIPVCVGGKGKENLNTREQAEEEELEKATKKIKDSFDAILSLTKELLIKQSPIADAYMLQKCPGGGDFFEECVHWYSIFELKELVHIALDNPKPVLLKIEDFERRVDEFIVTRIIQCDCQVICMKVDSQFSHIPAKIFNVDLLVNRVKKAVLNHNVMGKECKVWFCSPNQAGKLELHDAFQCSADVTGAIDQNTLTPTYTDSSFHHETTQSHGPLPFVAAYGDD